MCRAATQITGSSPTVNALTSHCDSDPQSLAHRVDARTDIQKIRKTASGWLIFRDECPGGEVPEQVAARPHRVIAWVTRSNVTSLCLHTDTCGACWRRAGRTCPSCSTRGPCACSAITGNSCQRGFEMDPFSANPNDWSWSLLTMTKTRSGRKRKG